MFGVSNCSCCAVGPEKEAFATLSLSYGELYSQRAGRQQAEGESLLTSYLRMTACVHLVLDVAAPSPRRCDTSPKS